MKSARDGFVYTESCFMDCLSVCINILTDIFNIVDDSDLTDCQKKNITLDLLQVSKDLDGLASVYDESPENGN